MPERRGAKRIETGSKTRAQVSATYGQRFLAVPLPASFDAYRTMSRQPTIALTMALIAAPVLAGAWSVEADDEVEDSPEGEEIKDFIRRELVPVRERLIESAIMGGIKFGCQPFEIVYGDADGKTGLDKVKALLQDITTILIDPATGEFAGYQQYGTAGNQIDIEPRYCLHVAFRVEGTQWWGESLLENARETYNQWREANAGAERYDAKVAGAHFVVHFPDGSTLFEGVETPNSEIADGLLDALESSGSIAVPNTQSAQVEQLSSKDPAWRIEILEDKSARQPTFVDRLKYLDTLLVRSILMPERAITEGQFGTKAEAGVHGDLAVTMAQQWDRTITEAVNRQVVDELLEQNWGPEMRGKVVLVPAPLVDAEIEFMRAVYQALLANPTTVLDVFPALNLDAVMDRVGLPKTEETVGEDAEGAQPEGLTLEQRISLAARRYALAS